MLRVLARLPLAWYHAAGAALGWIAYHASPRFGSRLRENLRASGVCADEAEYRRVLRENIPLRRDLIRTESLREFANEGHLLHRPMVFLPVKNF